MSSSDHHDDLEKKSPTHVKADSPSTEDAQSHQDDFSDVDGKKLLRKIDFRLIPFLSLLYLLSFLDRTAIGNARLFGMLPELGMENNNKYNIAAAVFYFTYALLEVPSNILLKRLSPPVWFAIISFFVGICMMGQGFTVSYGGIVAARVCLGAAEAGLFPGVNYLLSGWYPRRKFGLRAAIFFAAAAAAGALGGLLAVGLSQIRGGMYSGVNDGWRWIFIIIGIITCVIGITAYFATPDFPDRAKFLSTRERAYVIHTLKSGQQYSAEGEKFHWDALFKAALDIKTWVGMISYAGSDGPLYAFSVFTPTIIKTLGTWTTIESNLLSVPVYVVAAIFTVAIGYIADKKGNRCIISMCVSSVGIIGYIVLLSLDPRTHGAACYFAVYLSAVGIYPNIPNIVAMTSGVEGQYKRGVVMAWIISFGNLNGAATSNVFLTKQSPRYPIGYGIVLLYLVLGLLSSATYLLIIKRENNKREKGLCNETYLDHLPHEEAIAQAAEIRAKEIADLKQAGGLGNKFLALKKRLHSAPGGTYASLEEARRLKGDDWSGYRYTY